MNLFMMQKPENGVLLWYSHCQLRTNRICINNKWIPFVRQIDSLVWLHFEWFWIGILLRKCRCGKSPIEEPVIGSLATIIIWFKCSKTADSNGSLNGNNNEMKIDKNSWDLRENVFRWRLISDSIIPLNYHLYETHSIYVTHNP